MMEWIEAESSGHFFFYAFPVALLLLFFLMRGRRAGFLIPSVIITVLIVNPWFYKSWDAMDLYAYWRILWIAPIIPIVAAVFPVLAERAGDITINKPGIGNIALPVIAGVGILGIVFGGSFVYNTARGQFEREGINSSKLPEQAVEIADRLLELDEHPRIIAQHPIGVYIRQYTGEIDQLFGRDMDGYIYRANNDARDMSRQLSDPEGDLDAVATFMANDDYEYLVVADKGREEQLAEARFERIDHVLGYGIYRAHGTPTVIKEKNEYGQVISQTTIDENGTPVNGASGYATVSYVYDDRGNVIREFRTDVDGIAVANSNGAAGCIREYDAYAHVTMEKTIGPDEAAVANNVGYAEVKREYNGNNLIKESYYDEAGQLVNRADTQHAETRMDYDGNKNRISERYFDQDGNSVMINTGYAEVRRAYKDRRMTEERYYDPDGNPVTIAAGYAGKTRSYDAEGNITRETYYDEEWHPVNCVNGYATDEREYDADRNMILQRFLDADDHLVVTGSGYAEVHRAFENDLLIREEYYGSDGMPYAQDSGYTSIEQTWDGDILVLRTYCDPDGTPVNRVDGYSKAVWEEGEKCRNVKLYDDAGSEVEISGLNLARDIKYDADGWSNWMIPSYNAANSCQIIGYVNLGEKAEGDIYTCQIEIEFKNASASEGQTLRFWTQGAQDGKWITGNVWDGSLINLDEAPKDGIYRFTSTRAISGDMANISTFNIGFRCDYWASGMYRVRNVKIEKSESHSEWSQGI